MNNEATAKTNSLKHPIKAVAQRTGLSTHVIRVWERRYHAVTPKRTDTNRRLYSDEDIDRLQLLKRATEGGHNIGQIANLSEEALSDLIAQNESINLPVHASQSESDDAFSTYIDNAIQAIKNFDAKALHTILGRAAVTFSQPILIENIITPFMYKVGELWHAGHLRISHEHLASSVTRNFLENLNTSYAASSSAPNIIVTTPSGQLHELGAIIVSAVASANGWQVTYLGASLPAQEIAIAAIQKQAKAVALSLIYPADDPSIATELIKLKNSLPENTQLLIGGCATINYRAVIQDIGAIEIPNVTTLQTELSQLRTQ
ncbi:MAG: MerR family transcriptional regulator [Candidatus Latescibacteria bacterium]|jgi:MerR family transcriptional regulator, light-induced transcriptional regulator|nr:MerR family transcriptional regulator [Candidatus Latescibacterota bacterium]MBT4140689.1 MerR family transcriptional regulator [Candidatus Latescibacterota bacterium]MBT5829809.1 MerR family transcriptional regulator [Candidatus Latescibacterota bacterium]